MLQAAQAGIGNQNGQRGALVSVVEQPFAKPFRLAQAQGLTLAGQRLFGGLEEILVADHAQAATGRRGGQVFQARMGWLVTRWTAQPTDVAQIEGRHEAMIHLEQARQHRVGGRLVLLHRS
ncbi:hypothetical protein D3C77_573210 [compost metagenome]